MYHHGKVVQERWGETLQLADPHLGEVGYLEPGVPEPVALWGRRQRGICSLFSKGERFGAWSINTTEDSENRQYPSNAA